MISYYTGMKEFNELFDSQVYYEEGDADAEATVQEIYELCVKCYELGKCVRDRAQVGTIGRK